MHPVKAVPTRYNPFVNGEKPKKTHSSIKPVKTQKPAGLGFFKKTRFLKPRSNAARCSWWPMLKHGPVTLWNLCLVLPIKFDRKHCWSSGVCGSNIWGHNFSTPLRPPQTSTMYVRAIKMIWNNAALLTIIMQITTSVLLFLVAVINSWRNTHQQRR